MLNENARKWVTALRSGQYKQARSVLRSDYGFCCLGVACDLYDGSLWDSSRRFIGNDCSLPETVQSWLGLNSSEGKYFPAGADHYVYLTNDNDGGKTFTEIADIIELEPEGLFASGK